MNLVIDNRENKAIPILQQKNETYKINIPLSVEKLDIGDFILFDSSNIEDRKEIVIIERKSISDLASSIKDGRYSEQSLRLQNMDIHNHNIVYLIEGNIQKFCQYNKYNSSNEKTIYSAIWSLMFFKGFSVYHTESLQETCDFILRIADKTQREYVKQKYGFYTNYKIQPELTNKYNNKNGNENNNCNINNNIIDKNISTHNKSILKKELQSTHTESNILYGDSHSESKPYSHVVKKVKKQNITPENIGHIILSQIPGISNITSDAILLKYGSLYNLMKCLSDNPECLNGMTYETKTGQKRRLSSKCIQSIKDYLLYMKDSTLMVNV
jgi:ERCC4-type nuclease